MKEADKWRYGIVLDAGSSGTRSYVYRWPRNDVAGQDGGDATKLPEIKTKDKWTKKVQVGLSTYGETPQLVGHDHLKPLIDDALAHVPSSLVTETPVFLLATAGMRLLPERQRQQVLDAVCTYLQEETQLLIADCRLHIQVIPGQTEGLYGWIAANYLLGGFDSPSQHDHGKHHHTYGFLDMGGASAQIAFAPNNTEAAKHADNLTLLRLRNRDGAVQEHRVFVTTWLGFGVNEARKQYLGALTDSYAPTTLEYPDPCLPSGVRATLDSKSVITTALAPGEPYLVGTGQFDSCLRATLPLLKLHQPCDDEPCLFGQHVPGIDFDVNHFVGVSQYWHTTHEIFEMGYGDNPFDLATYQDRVHHFCSLAWADIQSAVVAKKYGKHVDEQSSSAVCFKASWLISILRDGLGIEADPGSSKTSSSSGSSEHHTGDHAKAVKDKAFLNPFTAVDTIDDTEVSWTLGKILLYASSTVPPQPSNQKLPVGFGSNTGEAIPADWTYPSSFSSSFTSSFSSSSSSSPPPPPPSSSSSPPPSSSSSSSPSSSSSSFSPPPPSSSSPSPSSSSSSAAGGITDRLPFLHSDSQHRIPGFIFFVLILIVIIFYIRHRIAAHLFGTAPAAQGRFAHLYSKPSPPGLLSRIPILGRFLAHRHSAASTSTSSYHRLHNAESGFGLAPSASQSSLGLANPSVFELGNWDHNNNNNNKNTSPSYGHGHGHGHGHTPSEESIRRSKGKITTPKSGPASRPGSRSGSGPELYPAAAAIDRAGVVLRTESRESLGLGLSVDPNQTVIRSKSTSRAATPLPR